MMATQEDASRLRTIGRGWWRALVEPTTGASGPWSRLASTLAPGDWIYRDAQYLVADFELDPRAARKLVPWPLRLAEPARAQVFTADFPHTTFGSVYREAGILFDVVHRGTRAAYSPWMIVDDDVALIAGRELLGYPKKLGEFAWSIENDKIHNVASRRGHRLIEMAGTLGARIESPPPMLGRPHRNVRTTLGLALPKVIAFAPRERVVEVREANITVTISGSSRDPLHEFGFGNCLGARLHRVDLGGRMPIPIGLASPAALLKQLLLRSR